MIWKYKKGNFKYWSQNGWKETQGSSYTCYPFAVHKKVWFDGSLGKSWVISHIATGREVGSFRLLKNAKECAKQIEHPSFLMSTSEQILSSLCESGSKDKILRIIEHYRNK